jgi:hypothetical protein
MRYAPVRGIQMDIVTLTYILVFYQFKQLTGAATSCFL